VGIRDSVDHLVIARYDQGLVTGKKRGFVSKAIFLNQLIPAKKAH
jgi:hypothetical protein